MNTDISPRLYQMFSHNTRLRSWPLCSTKERIFRPITGSTQGIRFRSRPPRKPNSIIKGIEADEESPVEFVLSNAGSNPADAGGLAAASAPVCGLPAA